jgi:DNA-directed RNA polymerase alpha subunit
MIDRHHLLECILWPNGDGTFRKIINRAERLKELGIYDDYKLTIQIDHAAHSTMHREFEKGTKYERIVENVGASGMYKRAKKLYKAGKMAEEEFQPFRSIWNEYKDKRRRNQRLLNSFPID